MSGVAGAIVGEVARRLLGQDVSVEKIIGEIKQEFLHELAALDARIEARLRERFEAIGLLVALQGIDEGPRRVLKAFDPPEHGTIPKLGIDVEMVDEITDDDRKAERMAWDNLKTPPEGSSNR